VSRITAHGLSRASSCRQERCERVGVAVCAALHSYQASPCRGPRIASSQHLLPGARYLSGDGIRLMSGKPNRACGHHLPSRFTPGRGKAGHESQHWRSACADWSQPSSLSRLIWCLRVRGSETNDTTSSLPRPRLRQRGRRGAQVANGRDPDRSANETPTSSRSPSRTPPAPSRTR